MCLQFIFVWGQDSSVSVVTKLLTSSFDSREGNPKVSRQTLGPTQSPENCKP